MATLITHHVQAALDTLKTHGQYRQLPNLEHHERYIKSDGKFLLNIASNDYLGLGCDAKLQAEFFHQMQQDPTAQMPKMGAASSRLLTGNDKALQALEADLQSWYQRAADKQHTSTPKSALVLNSGYHANLGILPALTSLPIKTLILADKLVHASIIDGMRLSQNTHVTYRRYRHNDYAHLARLLEQADETVKRILIVTESVFSMDGDRADVLKLVQLKAKDARIELYVDEAHAVGILGETGLGVAEETHTLADIDYLVGTFGKAFASMGAYILCDEAIKQWLINTMRPLIFSTALPPITHEWTRFVLAKMPTFTKQRQHVAQLSIKLKQALDPQHRVSTINHAIGYESPIIAYVLGDNAKALAKASQLQAAGFYARSIRPPTVPKNTARIRLVMSAMLTDEDCERLIRQL